MGQGMGPDPQTAREKPMKPQDFANKTRYDIQDLLTIMAILRSEDGCLWDREQNHHSIRNNLIEETYEAVEAIDREDRELLLEELGDVLMQVVFHAQMEAEQGQFTFQDVCNRVCQKLVYRHPHVFGEETVTSSGQVLDNWDKLKQREKQQETLASSLEGVSTALPSLMRAAKVQKRAAKMGLYPSGLRELQAQLQTQLNLVESALADCTPVSQQVGEMLFAATGLARAAGVDPEEALYRTTQQFIAQVSDWEALAAKDGTDLSAYSPDQLGNLFNKAKE